MSYAAIIPSRDDNNVIQCVRSLMASDPNLEAERIVIVSDGLSRETRKMFEGVTWVEGVKPFVYPRAINQGAVAAGSLDLFLLGDDVRLLRKGLPQRLAERAIDAVAVAPAVRGLCGQPAQRELSTESEAEWLAFVCVYIRRVVWNLVGPLDERFVGYGYDDMDWCLRSQGRGPLVVDHDLLVMHMARSSYRAQAEWLERYVENGKRFQDKWGQVFSE